MYQLNPNVQMCYLRITHIQRLSFHFSGPQFANIIMDQCQMPGTGKLTGGIRIKEDPHDYAEAGDKCDMHDKKGSK